MFDFFLFFIFCIIFKSVNTEKIYFLKLCLDGLKNLKQIWKKRCLECKLNRI
jgi:hypothetical protein